MRDKITIAIPSKNTGENVTMNNNWAQREMIGSGTGLKME